MSAPSSRLFTRALPVRTLPTLPFRRPISTAPPSRKSRSWKSSATRWGLALGGIYYYNNSDILAEEPPCPSTPSPQFTLTPLIQNKADRSSLPLPRACRRRRRPYAHARVTGSPTHRRLTSTLCDSGNRYLPTFAQHDDCRTRL